VNALGSWWRVPVVLMALVALGLPAGAQSSSWPRTLGIGTASPGGVYLVYGQTLARILSRVLKIEVRAEATQGAVQNVILLEKRETDLAFVSMGPALQGWNGSDWAKGTSYRSMRAIFPMYDTAFQFVANKSLGIKSISNFAGMRVGDGPRGGTSGNYAERLFKILGINAIVQHQTWENLVSQMMDRQVDGAFSAVGSPFPVLAELDARGVIEFIEPTSDEVAVVRNQVTEITPSIIRAGTYRSLARDYKTMGLYNFAVAHKDMPDDLVYQIVKTVFDNQAELVKAHPVATDTVPANIDRNTFLPLHPGAIRYYREIGVTVPLAASVSD
jgi:TRAP transporter TAXI family solute receptor